jgi:hypothetical protein
MFRPLWATFNTTFVVFHLKMAHKGRYIPVAIRGIFKKV